MRREKEAFDQLGAGVVLVGLGSVAETAAFKERFSVPFTMIADPEKCLFGAFRLKQASVGSLLSAKMVVKGVGALARGHTMGVPRGDVRQLPGVFIIDTAGIIRFGHYAASPADHPQPEALLAVLKK
ncbi:MAG: redoxin domain-containing protein [Desulfobacterales bacterium]|nr:redoxin domain-containing protein [Desulfobacterales bacterium]